MIMDGIIDQQIKPLFSLHFLRHVNKVVAGTLLTISLLTNTLQAEVITEPDVNSWSEAGFLIIVTGLALVVFTISITILYERKRKKQREFD